MRSKITSMMVSRVRMLTPDVPFSARPSPGSPRLGGCGATPRPAPRSGASSLLASVRRPAAFACVGGRARLGGPSCRPQLRPVGPGRLDGRGDLAFGLQLVGVAEAPEEALQFPGLERVMNLDEDRIGMRIPRSAWLLRDLRFLHS